MLNHQEIDIYNSLAPRKATYIERPNIIMQCYRSGLDLFVLRTHETAANPHTPCFVLVGRMKESDVVPRPDGDCR